MHYSFPPTFLLKATFALSSECSHSSDIHWWTHVCARYWGKHHFCLQEIFNQIGKAEKGPITLTRHGMSLEDSLSVSFHPTNQRQRKCPGECELGPRLSSQEGKARQHMPGKRYFCASPVPGPHLRSVSLFSILILGINRDSVLIPQWLLYPLLLINRTYFIV